MFVTVKSFFLLWLLVQPSTNHAFSAPKPQPTVTVRNELQGGQDLFLHCKSADEDLGVQHLHPLDTFSWSFEIKINFFMFLCSWVVREDGPCLVFDKDECYGWKTLEERPKFLS